MTQKISSLENERPQWLKCTHKLHIHSFVPNVQQMFSYIVYMMPKQKISWFSKTLPDTTSLKKSRYSYRARDYVMSSMLFIIHMILGLSSKQFIVLTKLLLMRSRKYSVDRQKNCFNMSQYISQYPSLKSNTCCTNACDCLKQQLHVRLRWFSSEKALINIHSRIYMQYDKKV